MAAANIAKFAVQVGLGGLNTLIGGSRLAVSAIGGLASAFGILLGAVKAAAIGLTAAAAVVSGFILINARAIDTVGKLNAKLKLGTDFIQKFRFAAQQAGVETITTDLALQRFVRRLGEAQKGTGELLPALRRMGIQLKDEVTGKFKSSNQVLLEFADGLKNTRQDTTKLALAFKAFDSEGAALVSLLEKGSDELLKFFTQAERLGFVLEQDAIKRVEEFNDNFNELVNIVRGAVQQFIGALAPALQQVTADLRELILAQTDGENSFKGLGEYLKNEFFDILISVTKGFEAFYTQLVKVFNFIASKINQTGLFKDKDVERLRSLVESVENLGISGPGVSPAGDPMLPDYSQLVSQTKQLAQLLIDIGVENEGLNKITEMGFLSTLGAGVGIGIGKIKEARDEMVALAKPFIAIYEASGNGQIPLIPDETLPAFAQLVEYLKSLKDLSAEIEETNPFDGIEEIIVTAEQTLLQKLFGLDNVVNFFKSYEKEGATAIDKIGAIATLVLGENVIEKLRESLSAAGFGDFQRTLADGLKSAALEFEDALTNAFMTGELSLKKFGDLLKQTLFKAFIQKTITGPIGALMGLASGGPAQAGRPYIIGEEGPEIFVPNSSGTVIPNDQLRSNGGGSMGTTNIHYTINATDPASFQAQIARDPEFIFAVTQAGARRLPGGR